MSRNRRHKMSRFRRKRCPQTAEIFCPLIAGTDFRYSVDALKQMRERICFSAVKPLYLAFGFGTVRSCKDELYPQYGTGSLHPLVAKLLAVVKE